MNRGKAAIWVVLTVIWAIYFAVGIPDFMYESGHWMSKAVSHHIFHANIFHLGINTASLFMLYRKTNRHVFVELPLAWLMASLSYMAALRPAIGLSDILYAVCGLRFHGYFPNWRSDRKAWLFIATLSVFCLIPGASGMTHAASFISSAAVIHVYTMTKGILDDYRKSINK